MTEEPRRPALVATDLDGTLLNPAGDVTPFTREVLEALWREGIETLFVTARPPRWVDALTTAVGGHGHAICANGAFLYDVANRRVVDSDLLPLADAVALAEDLRSAIPGVGFAVEHAHGMHVEPAYGDVGAFGPSDPTYGPLASAAVEGVGKLLARVPGGQRSEGRAGPGTVAPPAEASAFIDRVRDVVGHRAVVAYSGAVGLAEIGPPGVSKASALARWCERRGIDRGDVWAFGDMSNDIPMLRWAGRSFAVAGAPQEVRSAASDVCGGNDADGVARALRELVLRTDPGTA